MFIENFTKFIKYYGKGRKFKLFCFFILSLVAGLLEFIGIALIYPFILLIIKPQSVVYTKYYSDFSDFFHLHNALLNAFILGIIVAFLFIAKNLFMIFYSYLQNKFVNNWKFAISKIFMQYYLFLPYKNSLETPPSEKIYNLTFLIGQAIDGFIFRIINLMINATIVVMILILLFMKFCLAALTTLIFVIFSMLIQNKFFKKKIQEISKKLFKTSSQNNEKIIECINNTKEIKILSAEDYFYNDYLSSQKNYTNVVSENNFYSSIPPYVVEIFVVLALFILAGVISLQNIENTSWMIVSYAVITAAIFRIAPALNRIQSSITWINTSRDYAKTMIMEYEKLKLNLVEAKPDLNIEFKNQIRLVNINFSYKKVPVIKDLNLEIKKGEFIGIIGLSGAGKSTLADIIMGLLPIDSGKIFVDEAELNQENFIALRELIGYVPQQINVLDGTFKRNVAYGIDEEKIDENKVINALKMAQLHDFVSEFEDGINSKIITGSGGLSQGQKQRLAISRVLYRNPEILIFDEATSSLDVETEHEITQLLSKLKGEKTIVAIAHRLSTLRSCDRLIYLKKGRIIDTGTFEELSQKYTDFEKLIKLSRINNN